jgi:hypothetical protein
MPMLDAIVSVAVHAQFHWDAAVFITAALFDHVGSAAFDTQAPVSLPDRRWLDWRDAAKTAFA